MLTITTHMTMERLQKHFPNTSLAWESSLGITPQSTNIDPEFHLGDQVTHSTFLAPTSPFEILQISFFLTEIKYETSYPLSPLINKLLESRHVLKSMKVAKVAPIYKARDHDLISNYRPISILPSISKALQN